MMELNLTVTQKQKTFLDATADEVLYGGAAGGGKSYGQVVDALVYALKYGGIRQLVLRRTFPELKRSLILTSLALFPKGVCRYESANHRFVFLNGSVIEFGYCDTEGDVTQYQSAEYDVLRFDELTHFTEFQYRYLISRIRGVNGHPKQVKATTNPGGIGHNWVKERFIGHEGEWVAEDGRKRVFIPATVRDNRFLMDSDSGYLARLEQLPDQEKRALLYGDWDLYEGQAFGEFRNNPEGYLSRRGSHVITPFEIPAHWRRFRSFDFGYAKPFAVQWWAVDEDGRAYLYRQLYGSTGKPNEGRRWTVSQIGKEIFRIEAAEEGGRSITGIADPSIWDTSRGESVAEMLEREGVYFDPGDNARLAGKMQLHYRLQFDEGGLPMLYVFSTCRDFIRTLPALIYDRHRPEDIDTNGEDHDYDACRYFLMANPIAAKRPKAKGHFETDPLDRKVWVIDLPK